jgi:hypothetical protein
MNTFVCYVSNEDISRLLIQQRNVIISVLINF